MIITCNDCNSSFSISDGLIKDTGSKVRCSKCDSVFMAYPLLTEDIEDQMLAEDEDLGLDDLDSDLGDFLGDDEEDETLAMSFDIEESELDLDDFDDSMGAESGLESVDRLADTEGELELDLNFDQDDGSDLVMDEESIDGDDLPDLDDLENLSGLDETELTTDEIDFELEDLDFEMESEPDAELDLESGDGLDLADPGLEEEGISALDDPSTEPDAALAGEGSDELDLSDLEAAIDAESAPEDTAKVDTEELSLDLDTAGPDVAETADAGLDLGVSDELDLSDLDLGMEDVSASEEASAAGSEDLDLNLDLDLETETVAGSEEAAGDELDLSDITDIIEDEEAPAAQATADDSAQDLDMDLDFQIDDHAPTGDAGADSQDEDELDFSDLEQMLESDETPTVGATDSIETEELDLQFDLDEPSTAEADAEAAADPGAEVQEDDFLDIEQLLEGGEDNEPSEGVMLDGDATDMPLEMEAVLDDTSEGPDAELELDFDLESELQAKVDQDEDLFETVEETDQEPESNLLATDEVEFLEEAGIEGVEFQDTSQTSVSGTDEFSSDELAETNRDSGATQVLQGSASDLLSSESDLLNSESDLTVADYLAPEPVAYVPQKARSKKPLVVVVLLFLLAVGVLIVPNMLGVKIPYISDIKIPYLSDLDVKIPYLSDWLNPEPQDVAGNLKIIPLGNTINGKFVDNSRSGQLFVIQGQIKNDYDHPRSYIRVTGKLYLKGQKIGKTATVYCGNMLPKSDLAAMDIKFISKKLRNRSGDKRSNVKVKTGKRVPFMIVFDKLPRNLDEYTVEVEGSSI